VAVKILVLKSMFASFGRLECCQNISQSALQLLQITVSVSVISISDFSKVLLIFIGYRYRNTVFFINGRWYRWQMAVSL